MIANTIANPLGLLDEIIEEVAHIVRDAVDHRKHLFEHVADEVRGRNAEILGESPYVIGELLGNARVEYPLFAGVPAMVAAATALVGTA